MMNAEIEMKKMKWIIGWNDRFFKIIPIKFEGVTKRVSKSDVFLVRVSKSVFYKEDLIVNFKFFRNFILF